MCLSRISELSWACEIGGDFLPTFRASLVREDLPSKEDTPAKYELPFPLPVERSDDTPPST